MERFEVGRTKKGLRAKPYLNAHIAARLMADPLDGKPGPIYLHASAVDDPDDPDAALAIEVSGPPDTDRH